MIAGIPAPAAPPRPVPDAPGDLDGYDAYQGQTFHFMVLGESEGGVWGTDIYTLDSRVAAAAVHAGIVKPGEKKEAAILMLPGQTTYRGSARHGVTTSNYGEYRASYRFLQPGEAEPDPGDGRHPLVTPDNVRTFKPRVGETLLFKVTGASEGGVWGTTVYSADSNLAAAAVHAGMVRPGETANLRVTILPGQKQYRASESNGITSAGYGEYDLSFRFEPKPTGTSAVDEAAKSRP